MTEIDIEFGAVLQQENDAYKMYHPYAAPTWINAPRDAYNEALGTTDGQIACAPAVWQNIALTGIIVFGQLRPYVQDADIIQYTRLHLDLYGIDYDPSTDAADWGIARTVAEYIKHLRNHRFIEASDDAPGAFVLTHRLNR